MNTAPELTQTEEIELARWASDEDYWDYLDRLEVQAGETREWDNPTGGVS